MSQTATPPSGTDIPGLRGAPMRTPVRAVEASGGPDLWPALVGRLFTRQLWIELYGLPGYGLTLKGRGIDGFAASPGDARPVDPDVGEQILQGRFALAGASLEISPSEDPFDRPSPSRAFAAALHRFDWMPALMTQGEAGRREALRLTFAWAKVFGRWSPFAWDPAVLARRAFQLACAARRLGKAADDVQRRDLADLLNRHGRQLLRPPGGVATEADRVTAAAVVGCALAGEAGVRLRRRALKRLPEALARTVTSDGAHASRSPQAGLELLLDLLALEDALAQVSEPGPDALADAVGRLRAGLAATVLPDGRLAAFQGGGPSRPERVASALAEPSSETQAIVRIGGLVRLRSPLLTVVADGAGPAGGGWSTAACAQPLALEIVCGRDRLVTGCGWTPDAPERQGLRVTPGHSTLTLGEGSVGQPLSGWKAEVLGPRLVGAPLTVTCEQRAGEGAVWLEMEHDGWVREFGLLHQRRLYLDQRLDELRAEERLHPAPGSRDAGRAIAAPYAVRFHLEPGVQASLARERRTILLRGQSGRGWWFRTDGPDVAIEPAVHIDEGLTRRSTQIVVRGSARTDAETKVRWKLSPAGAGNDPAQG